MAVMRRLCTAMRTAARAVTAATANGLPVPPEAWAVLLLPPPATPTAVRVVRAEACSLASRGRAVREVLLTPRLERRPEAPAGPAVST